MLYQLPATFSHDANRANVRRTNTVDTKVSFSHAQSTRGYDSNKHAWTPVSHSSADKKGKPCGLCALRKWSSSVRKFGKTNTRHFLRTMADVTQILTNSKPDQSHPLRKSRDFAQQAAIVRDSKSYIRIYSSQFSAKVSVFDPFSFLNNVVYYT
jgi:hypothetical protein